MPYASRISASNRKNQSTNEQMQLQSASNLHRDKKNNFLNSKMHQTCTGTKKQKKQKLHNLLGKGRLSLQSFCFFVFFVPVQVLCTLTFKTFVFFVPGQVWCTLEFKALVFLSLCRFGGL